MKCDYSAYPIDTLSIRYRYPIKFTVIVIVIVIVTVVVIRGIVKGGLEA